MPKDPVCNMEVKESSRFRSEYKGKSYYFCSSLCKQRFDSDPSKYT
jgi:YHS domain-containing protein